MLQGILSGPQRVGYQRHLSVARSRSGERREIATFNLTVIDSAGAMVEDLRYLVTRGRIYWLQIATPRTLHKRTRRVVQKSLRTASLREAQARRWSWINAYRIAWERALADESMTAEEIEEIANQEHATARALEEGSRRPSGATDS